MDWVDWKMIHLVFCILAMRLNDHLGDNVLVFRNREREERRERESKRETEREREILGKLLQKLPGSYLTSIPALGRQKTGCIYI
jgi:hypothetical protein